eukprot:3418623-Pleurochrysis_carterae.AAC.6
MHHKCAEICQVVAAAVHGAAHPGENQAALGIEASRFLNRWGQDGYVRRNEGAIRRNEGLTTSSSEKSIKGQPR